MPLKKKRAGSGKKRRHVIFILLLIMAGTLLFIRELGKEKTPKSYFDLIKPFRKSEPSRPGTQAAERLPKIAIVMDDLGPSRRLGEKVLDIDVPITLSILPRQPYSEWVAKEGKARGRDIIVHLPMEAAEPLRLGEGGLYTWMNNGEIIETMENDIRSVPYSKGASNHMGSAFTKDSRTMSAVITGLKKQDFFFLDSFTTPDSVGFKIAKSSGLPALRRDIFLDDSDNPGDIEIQWNRLLKLAKERGHAIALAHPKKNTLKFLKKALKDNKQVIVVPVSEFIR